LELVVGCGPREAQPLLAPGMEDLPARQHIRRVRNEHEAFWFLAGLLRVFGRVKTGVFHTAGVQSAQ
jgi:hypothetical protein